MIVQLRLKDIRIDHDLYQRQLAEYLHCKQQTYSRYETGEVQPPLEVMEKLSAYYDTSVDYLMGITNEKTPYKKNQPLR